ncbi:transglycosylase family protein [Salinifilum ghardaiensis]
MNESDDPGNPARSGVDQATSGIPANTIPRGGRRGPGGGADQWRTGRLAGVIEDTAAWHQPRSAERTWIDPSEAQSRPAARASAVGVLDRPRTAEAPDPVLSTQDIPAIGSFPDTMERALRGFPSDDYPSIPPGTLEITPQDVYEALGSDAEDLLATADIDVHEVIRLINAETTVLPAVPLPVVPDEPAEAEAQPEAQSEADREEGEEALTAWKRRFVKGAVAAVVLSLTGGGAAAAAMDKSVTVEVDGKELSVNTYDSTVGEVLEDEGINVGPHDALSPSPQAEVNHGDTITLDRGRLMKVSVDGQQREEWVRSATVGQALRQMGVSVQDAQVSADLNRAVPRDGMTVSVQTSKDITVVDGSGQPRPITTHAVTVQDLLREQNLELGPQDEVTPGGGQKITDGTEVRIDRTDRSVINVRQPIEPPVQEIVDNSMLKGEEHVENPGKAGEKILVTRVTEHNGDEVSRETINEKVVQQAEPRVIRVGGKEPPNSGVWDKLVQCEAGGNWQINSGNGYYGGLQFDKSTWDAFGGDQYAEYPHQASREQQISVAEKVRDSRGGYGAWPACSSELGLS